jgi:hypothetical protein
MASALLPPHIAGSGRSRAQTSGRSGWPKIMHRLATLNCTQRTPAGLPAGIPGIGELIDKAMQQAPQPLRQNQPPWGLARSAPSVSDIVHCTAMSETVGAPLECGSVLPLFFVTRAMPL